ncbi:MAG: methionyl-tRNA formyltransferase, partial [bacterium]
MRLIVMGQQAFGKDALEKLLGAGTDEVVAVYCEPDRVGRPVDPVKEFALEKGLPVEQPAHFKEQETL